MRMSMSVKAARTAATRALKGSTPWEGVGPLRSSTSSDLADLFRGPNGAPFTSNSSLAGDEKEDLTARTPKTPGFG
jgi:hypothetical protein